MKAIITAAYVIIMTVSLRAEVYVYTNVISSLSPSTHPMTFTTIYEARYTVYARTAGGSAVDLTEYTLEWQLEDTRDGKAVGPYAVEVISPTAGIVRAEANFSGLEPGTYRGRIARYLAITNYDGYIADDFITILEQCVGCAPDVSVGDVTVISTNIQNQTFYQTFNITNATYVTGGLISNVVTGTSNYWDASTGTLHINQDGCQSYTIGTTGQAYNTVWQIDDCTVLIGTNAVTTLGGYTAQQIADLERSSANFDFTVLAWTPTVSVSRADGVFQYLTTEGPTWVQVPAGLTNMGYMINLDVAATTNSITFLPDNILIATNLYTYTNRTMTFLLHNPWNEETVGVYGLKRDND